MNPLHNRRILVIDDTPAIHEDFRKVLTTTVRASDLGELEAALFGTEAQTAAIGFELDSAYQGQEGLAKVRQSLDAGLPYAMAFVDMRMPPGWDGVETIERLWQADPELQIVICTAYSDYAWDEVLARLDVGDRLLILKKPFDAIEVSQLASALTAKRQMTRQAALKMADLDAAIELRTEALRQANEALKAEIVEHAKAEAALKLAASVFDNTMDGVMITDTAGSILSVNPAFTAITGYSAAEAIGRQPSLLHSDHHGPDFYRELWAVLQREGRWDGEIWNRRKNGEAYLEWLSIGMVAGDDGQPLRYVGVFNDITELRKKDEHIRHLAFHDPLTGLPNRALLLDRLEHGLAFAERAAERLGVMFLDLDRFKHVNDSLGHNIGDALLQEVARRLGQSLRQSDTVARTGGDEFVILLEHVDEPEACANLAKKIIASLCAPMVLGGHTLQVGASIGIACFPDDGADVITLMKHADAAMYAAKSAGRATFAFFEASLNSAAVKRLRLESALRHALARGEIEVHFQPKVDAAGRACSVEALARWTGSEFGAVSPATFIPIAEETGLIEPITEFVLRTACSQAAQWHRAGFGPLAVAVNLSPRLFRSGSFAAQVAAALADYGLPAGCLELEITEGTLMDEGVDAIEQLRALKALGVRLAVDDFGTGYSSLAYLTRFPLDILKIDKSFVSRATEGEGEAILSRAIVTLGRDLGLRVVAEGVETETQWKLFAGAGCHEFQGYLFARALPASSADAWLAANTATASA